MSRAESDRPGRRRGITVYLSIAFGLAWSPFAVAQFGGPALGPVLMPVAPAIACVVVRRWVTREGFAELALRPSWRGVVRRLRVLGVALLWPLVTMPVALLLSGARPSVDAGEVAAWLALSLAVAPALLGEELGWRGYLQPRVCPGRPLAPAVATGVTWGVWHYPLLLGTVGLHPLLLVEFTIGTVTMSIFLGWLHGRTATVWAPSLGHASNNVTEDNLTHRAFGSGTPGPGAAAAVLVAEAVVVLGVVLLDRRRHGTDSPLSGEPRHVPG